MGAAGRGKEVGIPELEREGGGARGQHFPPAPGPPCLLGPEPIGGSCIRSDWGSSLCHSRFSGTVGSLRDPIVPSRKTLKVALGTRSALRPKLRPCPRLPAAPAAPTRPSQAEPRTLGCVSRRPQGRPSFEQGTVSRTCPHLAVRELVGLPTPLGRSDLRTRAA